MAALRSTLPVVVALVVAMRADAFVLGGGRADSDCRVAFGGLDATDGASQVTCTDGDPGCDADGAANGACRFVVSVCTHVPTAGCAPATLDALALAGLALAPPPLPAAPGACGASSEIVLPVGTAAGATAIARGGGALRDVDYLALCCTSNADALAVARCALGVDLAVAGCAAGAPGAAREAFARARSLIAQAVTVPGRTRTFARRAARALRRVRRRARRLAEHDDCGYTLALVASHGLAAVEPLRAGTASSRPAAEAGLR